MEPVEFRILGPLEVRRQDRLLAGGGGKRRALLAFLLLSANRPVTARRLAQVLWGAEPPASATNIVQGYVSDWRTVLDPAREPRSSGERLLSAPSGYCLRVAPEECDLLRFSARADQGRRALEGGDLLMARRLLQEALQEWRGPPLADVDGETFAGEASRLDGAFLTAVEAAADTELQLGRADRALAYLERPAALHPLRESITALQMTALYRLGRQTDALAVYSCARTALAEELGIDPGPQLSRVHLQVLRQEAALLAPDAGPTTPTNLPAQLSSFVGRGAELAAVVEQVRTHRLVTLTGPGGSGKTRLALEAAAVIAAEADQDVTFVDLSPVEDPDLLWSAVATALGRTLAANLEATAAVALHLGARPTLLVLDNMEQLLGAAPGLAQVLSRAPRVSVLATSREPLGVAGEQLFPVPPLALPSAAAEDSPLVLETGAVRLFAERAAAADPAFAIDAADVRVAVGICRRLDGLPLAIELAAPWTRTLSLRALLERLDQPLRLLVRDERTTDRPDRHRTLRAAIEWSYVALTAEQRTLLDQLSVFVSGARLDGVEAVAGAGRDPLPTLAQLIDKSLVQRTGPSTGARYRLLLTIREYAAEQLRARPEDQREARDRHAAYICGLAEQAARSARTPAASALTQRLAEEQDEVRAALVHLRDVGAPARVLALVVDALALWWDVGHVREGCARAREALHDAAGVAPDELLSAGSAVSAMLDEAAGQPRTALARARAATTLAQRARSVPLEGLGRALEGNTLAWLDWSGSATAGLALLAVARALGRGLPATGLRWGWSSRDAVFSTATVAMADVLRHRDPQRAADLLGSLRDDPERPSDAHISSFVVRALGFLAGDAGRWAEAEDLLGTSLDLAVAASSRRSESRSREELARVAWARGDLEGAVTLASEATRLSRDCGHALNWSRCACLLATVHLERGDHRRADELLVEAETALTPGYSDLVLRSVGPLRARLARLSGDDVLAGRRLRPAAALETAAPLTPERVVYLVERAHRAAARDDRADVSRLVALLADAAAQIGLVLPRPELDRLEALAR